MLAATNMLQKPQQAMRPVGKPMGKLPIRMVAAQATSSEASSSEGLPMWLRRAMATAVLVPTALVGMWGNSGAHAAAVKNQEPATVRVTTSSFDAQRDEFLKTAATVMAKPENQKVAAGAGVALLVLMSASALSNRVPTGPSLSAEDAKSAVNSVIVLESFYRPTSYKVQDPVKQLDLETNGAFSTVFAQYKAMHKSGRFVRKFPGVQQLVKAVDEIAVTSAKDPIYSLLYNRQGVAWTAEKSVEPFTESIKGTYPDLYTLLSSADSHNKVAILSALGAWTHRSVSSHHA